MKQANNLQAINSLRTASLWFWGNGVEVVGHKWINGVLTIAIKPTELDIPDFECEITVMESNND